MINYQTKVGEASWWLKPPKKARGYRLYLPPLHGKLLFLDLASCKWVNELASWYIQCHRELL
jgi:hypothetical protein